MFGNRTILLVFLCALLLGKAAQLQLFFGKYCHVSFVVDMTQYRDTYFLFAYVNGADSYIKLQLLYLDSNDTNSFKNIFLKKRLSLQI